MSKKLKPKDDSFICLKGKINKLNKKEKKLEVGLNLNETFEDPPKPMVEKEVLIPDEVGLFKVILDIKSRNDSEESEKKKIKLKDLKENASVLIIPTEPEKALEVLSSDSIEAGEIILFSQKEKT